MNPENDCSHESPPADAAPHARDVGARDVGVRDVAARDYVDREDGEAAATSPCPLPSSPLSRSSRARYLLHVKVVQPLLNLMRQGATPEKLAWSLAVGFSIGVNPLLGSTTIVCLAFAYMLRLNIVASQLANHLVYPLELLLLLPFIRLGQYFFRSQQMPWTPGMLLHLARVEPIRTTKLLWMWEWHALVVWAALSALLVPALAVVLTPLLRHAQRRLARRGVLPAS